MAESKPTLKASVESNNGANVATFGPPLAAVFHTSPSAETAGYADDDHDPLPAPSGFVIGKQIGVDSMGQVFRASRGSQTGALKVMHPELSTDFDRREQFEWEMMALMKRERHPSLVNILRFGKCDDFGCWYFVMPLVPGPTLTKHLADAARKPGVVRAAAGTRGGG